MNDSIDVAKTIPHWAIAADEKSITRHFSFKDFKQAWAFMSECADYAEEINHHPEWLNVYNRVAVTLTTHDSGGLSALDIKMTTHMNTIAERTLTHK